MNIEKLKKASENFGTPLYVLDEVSVRAGCIAYKDALKKYYPGRSLRLQHLCL